MLHLQGKRALVTGAASGIGRALALRLAAQGVHLLLADVNGDGLAEVCEQAGRLVPAECRVCDLADPLQIDALADHLRSASSRLDVLVNCAGIAYYGRLDRMTDAQFDRVLAINLHAPIRLTRRLLPLLLANRRSHVLNVCSMLGLFAQSKLCAYQVSKFALIGFSESLLADYARFGLGVTALCPGYVTTSLFANGSNAWSGAGTKVPPRWVCSTPELVAERAVAAIRWNRPLVTVGLLARTMCTLKRLAPYLFLRVPGLRRKKRFEPTNFALSNQSRRAA